MLTISEISEKLKPIFENNHVKKAILFGSHVTENATDKSDIDLFIDTEDHVRGLMFYGIRSEVEDALRKKVDLIVERDIVKGSPIDFEIKHKGVVIYG